MLIDYLKGLGIILLFVSWVVIFNYAWWKSYGEKLWEEANPFAAIIIAFILPVGLLLLLIFPLILIRG